MFKKWSKLGRPRDPDEWEMYPSMVNAYFNPPANEVCCSCPLLHHDSLTLPIIDRVSCGHPSAPLLFPRVVRI